MKKTDNPLLESMHAPLPLFDRIRPEVHALPALDTQLAENHMQIDRLTQFSDPDWDALMAPLEALDERLGRVWGPVTHLNAVCDSDELRPIYQQGVQKVTAYCTELAQNEALFKAVKKVRARNNFHALADEQQQVIEHTLRDFRLAGAELEGKAKARFKDIQMRLSELGTQFEQNVLDATRAFELHIKKEADLAGLPDSIRAAAAQRAKTSGKDGWLFTLDIPSYLPFMQYAENRALRQQMYTSYVTRASNGRSDNSPLIEEILRLKQESATLLGYAHYAECSLVPKMATSVEEVTSFLRELAGKSRPMAEQEYAELQTFARERLQIETLEAWDVPYASEQLRQHRYAISQEDLKPYFPEPQVLDGLFGLMQALYGLTIRRNDNVPRWHEDVRYYDIYDGEVPVAGFYFDPYARARKRGGAWMDECIIRWRRPDDSLQLPVAYLVCNFEAPIGNKP
ncbi:MAG: M3 family metallopeptidase, partial [Mariprofundaceae bacterium]